MNSTTGHACAVVEYIYIYHISVYIYSPYIYDIIYELLLELMRK